MSGGAFRKGRYDAEALRRSIEEMIDHVEEYHDLPDEVVEDLTELSETLEEHQDLLHGVDYLAAGDHGPETFLEKYGYEK